MSQFLTECPKCKTEAKYGDTGCQACGHCLGKVETMSRVTGFYRPVQQWNKGKVQEQKERVNYKFAI